MLTEKLAQVKPSHEAEYPASLVAGVHQAYEKMEEAMKTFGKLEGVLAQAPDLGEEHDFLSPFYKVKNAVESSKEDTQENWKSEAVKVLNDHFPKVDGTVVLGEGFETPEEFFTVLHDAFGADLANADKKALIAEFRRALGLDSYRGNPSIKGDKTFVIPFFAYVDTWFEERVSGTTFHNLSLLQSFMHKVMGDSFRVGDRYLPYDHTRAFDIPVSAYFGGNLDSGEDSIMHHIRLYKNQKTNLVFKTPEGLRSFLRALDAEDLLTKDSEDQ